MVNASGKRADLSPTQFASNHDVANWQHRAREHKMANNTSWSGSRRSFPTKTRQRILRRDKLCANCNTNQSTIADHIIGHAEATRLGWTQQQIDHISNAQGLCDQCHNDKTAVERRHGQQLAGRKRPPRNDHPGRIR